MSLDLLTEKLQSVFKTLRGYGKLSESNVADAVREVRLALLAADVNYQVAKDFCEEVKNEVAWARRCWRASGPASSS
jgi:signal recognition particle subunit SRP54